MKMPPQPPRWCCASGDFSPSGRQVFWKRHSAVTKWKRGRSLVCGTRRLSWLVALAALALASSSATEGSLAVLAADESAVRSSIDDTNNETPPQAERKPYRQSSYGGRIKLVPSRKIIRVVTVDELNTTPWKKNQRNGGGDNGTKNEGRGVDITPRLSSPTREYNNNISSNTNSNDKASPTLWETIAPFAKRGLLLVALMAVAIVDRNPAPTATAALLPSTTLSTATKSSVVASSSWTNRLIPSTNLRLDWNKLGDLPGQILPSLSAALMIAWIPNLILQKAWYELGFLVLSLTSQEHLRNYLLTEVLPSMGGTVRKLVWSEFWKQAWDYLLEPFSSNIMVPNKESSLSSSSSENEGWSEWQLEVSRFWSDRVVSRIDKWTASSVKALLQKNVQTSVNSLAEDSLKAFAFGWYPEGSIEDTTRMIELETGCEHENNNDDCEDEDEKTATSMAVDSGAEETTEDSSPSDDSSESTSSGCDDEDSSTYDDNGVNIQTPVEI